MQIIVRHDDGTEHEITEGVQIAYDAAYNSMDWGSGFLDLEEMESIALLAEACRFPSYEDAWKEIQGRRREQEQAQERADRQAKAKAEQNRVISIREAEVAAAMRAAEPGLDPSLDDHSLFRLYQMRLAGTA